MIATVLFLTWSLELRTYPAFLILLFLAFVSLVWLVFIAKPARAVVTIPAIASTLSVAFVVVGAAKPEVLWFIASAFDSMDWQYVAALAAIIVVSVALIVIGAARRRRRVPAPAEEFNPS